MLMWYTGRPSSILTCGDLRSAQTRTDETIERAAQNISHLAVLSMKGRPRHEPFLRNPTRDTKKSMLEKFIAKVDRLTGEDQNGLHN
jgi:hypothetical protein